MKPTSNLPAEDARAALGRHCKIVGSPVCQSGQIIDVHPSGLYLRITRGHRGIYKPTWNRARCLSRRRLHGRAPYGQSPHGLRRRQHGERDLRHHLGRVPRRLKRSAGATVAGRRQASSMSRRLSSDDTFNPGSAAPALPSVSAHWTYASDLASTQLQGNRLPCSTPKPT